MEISKGKMFKTLFIKDVLLAKNESLLILGLIIVGNLFLYYKSQTSWPLEMSLAFSWVLAMFIPLSIFIRSFTSISSEWKENTVYLIMSLPITGSMVLSSKLLALITRLIILLMVALPFTANLFFRLDMVQMLIGPEFRLDFEIIKIFAMYLILVILLYTMYLVLAFFSVHIGRLVNKFSGLVTFITFLISNFLVSKILEISYETVSLGIEVEQAGVRVNHHLLSSEFLLASTLLLLITGIIFFITASIYDKKIEL